MGAGSRPMSRAFIGAVRADQIRVRPVQPDLQDQRRVGRLCASPQAVRATPALGPCGRPRISAAVGAASARFPGAAAAGPVRRPGRDRRDLLRDGAGEGPPLCEWRAARIRSRHAPAIYEQLVDTLADLHNIDPDAAELGDFGKPGNYFERQVMRWTRQYRDSRDRLHPADGAADRVPARDAARAVADRRSSMATIASTMSCSTATAR